MDRLSLQAEERTVLGKKVKKLRKDGLLPAHVFGKGLDTESITVTGKTFLKIFREAGETGLIDLKIGTEKVRPVLVRGVQFDPISGDMIHIDFYQVDVTKKVKVPVPLVLIGEDPEAVKSGEAVVMQNLHEIEVEALPADLVEKIEVNISPLQKIDDVITVGQLNFDRTKLTIQTANEEIVVKLAPAITEEMKKQMEEEAAAQAAATAEAQAQEGGEGAAPAEESAAPAEGEVPAEGEQAKAEGHGPEASKGGEAKEAAPKE